MKWHYINHPDFPSDELKQMLQEQISIWRLEDFPEQRIEMASKMAQKITLGAHKKYSLNHQQAIKNFSIALKKADAWIKAMGI